MFGFSSWGGKLPVKVNSLQAFIRIYKIHALMQQCQNTDSGMSM